MKRVQNPPIVRTAKRAKLANGVEHPPSFTSTKAVNGRARFTCSTAAVDQPIRRVDLLQHLLLGAGATSAFRVIVGFRLKSVAIWAIAGNNPTTAATATCSVEWLSEQGPTSIRSDTSLGLAQPAHILASPPPGSLAGFWSVQGSSESTSLFLITCPIGSVVDITYEFILQNGETATSVTVPAATPGKLFMTSLDGTASNKFVPVSYQV